MRDVLLLLRPWFWIPSLAAGIAGARYASSNKMGLAQSVLLFVILGPGIAGFAEALNEVADRQLDQRSEMREWCGIPLASGSGVLARRGYDGLHVAKLVVLGSLVSALLLSACISITVFLLATLGIILSYAYSEPPVRAKARGLLGFLFLGIGYGPVAFTLGLTVAGGAIDPRAVGLGLVAGLWVACVGMTSELIDLENDLKNGVCTFSVLLGRGRAGGVVVAGGVVCLTVLTREFLGAGMSSDAGTLVLFVVTVVIFFGLSLTIWRHRARRLPTSAHALAIVLEGLFPFALVGAASTGQ